MESETYFAVRGRAGSSKHQFMEISLGSGLESKPDVDQLSPMALPWQEVEVDVELCHLR